LRQLASVDLFGVDRERARRRLLDAVAFRRGKPDAEPRFPAGGSVTSSTGASVAELPPNLPTLWNVPPRLAHFTGRGELLDVLHGQLTDRGTGSVCAVHGLGGVGKTALALEYVHRHAGNFDVVWWLVAEDPRLLSGQVAMLGMRLGLRDGVEWPAVATALRDQGRRWLVVLDNVDDPEVVSPFRPSDPRGRLLVTSRLAGLDGVGGTVAVNEFTPDEALRLLTRRLSAIDTPLATRIAHLLGCLPLALEQAIAYLAQTALPAAEYAGLLEARLGDMLRRGRVADRPNTTIANLWELSVARLRFQRPASVALLELCAVCAADPIPLDLVTGGVDELPEGSFPQAAKDPLEWADTVGALVGYSLARRDGRSLTVHRLTAAATRSALGPATELAVASAAARLLTAALPRDVYNTAGWPRWRELLPHVFAVLDRDNDSWSRATARVVSVLCDLTGRYLNHQGRPDLAVALLLQGLALDEAHLGPDHRDTLTSRYKLAVAYETAGRLDEAIRQYEQSVADMSRVLGPDDPETLASRHNLAVAYVPAGLHGEAIELCEQVLADRVRVLGADDVDTLRSRNGLAGAYQTVGRLDEAISLHEQILADRTRLLGPDHRDTLASRNNLAGAYVSAGRQDEAIDLYEQLLADAERVHGADYPDTLRSRSNLAVAYEKAGRLDEAIHLLEGTLSDAVRILNPDHPDVLTWRNNLANLRLMAGRASPSIEGGDGGPHGCPSNPDPG
jgi:tetratricopeptide (TPR) repeat protein